MVRPAVNHLTQRIARLKELLRKKRIISFLVTEMHNVRYLTGFTGSSGFLFVAKNSAIFVTDFRYKEQAKEQIKHCDVFIEQKDMIQILRRLVASTKTRKLGIESSVSYHDFMKIRFAGFNVIPLSGVIENLRESKDAYELQTITKAVKRAEAAFRTIKPYIRQGRTERSIALRLEAELKKHGCRKLPFDIIVASGPHASMPHAQSTARRLCAGDLVIIDWGGEADGYFSDMTRTLLIKGGDKLEKKKEIYRIVLEANERARESVSTGVKTSTVDAAARNFIELSGYGRFFGHGTGHGVGLQVHESPRITWGRKDRIREDMVFTIEPGIYLPNTGGVRIEDMVTVSQNKGNVLTSLPRRLEII